MKAAKNSTSSVEQSATVVQPGRSAGDIKDYFGEDACREQIDMLMHAGLAYDQAERLARVGVGLGCIRTLVQISHAFTIERNAYEDGNNGCAVISDFTVGSLQTSIEVLASCLHDDATVFIGEYCHHQAQRKASEAADFDARR